MNARPDLLAACLALLAAVAPAAASPAPAAGPVGPGPVTLPLPGLATRAGEPTAPTSPADASSDAALRAEIERRERELLQLRYELERQRLLRAIDEERRGG